MNHRKLLAKQQERDELAAGQLFEFDLFGHLCRVDGSRAAQATTSRRRRRRPPPHARLLLFSIRPATSIFSPSFGNFGPPPTPPGYAQPTANQTGQLRPILASHWTMDMRSRVRTFPSASMEPSKRQERVLRLFLVFLPVYPSSLYTTLFPVDIEHNGNPFFYIFFLSFLLTHIF